MEKRYRYYGADTAIELLRPHPGPWQFNGREITIWNDPRPKPTGEEIVDAMNKIKAMEDSIDNIWL
jgi:hypothetical protein